MGNAFLTRNPILPDDYFQAPEIDSFVRKLNEDVPYNLIENCDGQIHRRRSNVLGTQHDRRWQRRKSHSNPTAIDLVQCAKDANAMVTLLRKDGVEAYQFHDRTQSIVTIGSFDELGRELDVMEVLNTPRPILAVMDEYRAFNIDPQSCQSRKTSKWSRRVPVKCVDERFPFDIQPMPIAVPKTSKRSLYSAAMRR